MEEVTCSMPTSDLDATVGSPWTPYSTTSDAQTQPSTFGFVKEVSRQRILLCKIMAPLGYSL